MKCVARHPPVVLECIAIIVAYSLISSKCALSFQPPQRSGEVASQYPRLARWKTASVRLRVDMDKRAGVCSNEDRQTYQKQSPVGSFPTSESIGTLDTNRRHLLISMLATASSGGLVARSSAEMSESTTLDPQPLTETLSASSPDFLGIIKPPLDERDYVAYTLENGLRVLLCSDPSSSNEAAAAMDVHVGACSDPDYLPGLAHFNEHMLFLGTKKYKQEDSFGKYLALNGGSSNAYTDSENTVYFFTINAEADNRIAEGLSRFGSFFSGPLFAEGTIDREVNAIESENAKNLQSDLFRNYQITKARANQGHPFSKFYTGNKKTLIDGAAELGIDLRLELLEFYNQYYSANQMTLAVVAPQPIDALKKMVNEAFSDIPNRMVSKPEEAWAGVLPFTNGNNIIPSFRHVVEIVPVSDLRQLQVSWPVVYRSQEEKLSALLVKPSEYVAHLLGHEGPRSLLSYLKRKGWAYTLGCSNTEELSDFETFDVVVGLTPRGLAAIDSIVEAVFSFVTMLQKRPIPDYVFQEVLQLQELQWRFYSKGGAGGCTYTYVSAV
jgi:insulysin